MEKLRIWSLPVLLTGVLILSLSSCEKISEATSKIGDALNREPEPLGPANQPDPTKLLADEPDFVMPPPPNPDDVKTRPQINKDARVSILGYHDFTEDTNPRNDMIINIEDFRNQMQAIKDAELPVISMQQFLAWKRGEADLPPESVMITIDDGWKATHTLALDVFKEFGYPFTVFLYKNYVGVGGRSMTHDEIRELIAGGGTIGSHSISHNNMAKKSGKSADAYREWLKLELEESFNFLQENFGDTGGVTKTFAYPYGIYSDQIKDMALDFGYDAAFTVNGKKTKWPEDEEEKDKKEGEEKTDDADAKKLSRKTDDDQWGLDGMEIGRYIVHGTTLANFGPALAFGGGSVSSSGRKLISESKNEDGEVQGPLVTMHPLKDSTVTNRLPRIEIDLSKLDGVVAESISMRVTGLGHVPVDYDPNTGIGSYQIPQRLRGSSCGVMVEFRHAGNKETEKIGWNFKINQLAEYLSNDNTKIEEEVQIAPPEKNEDGQVVAKPTAQN